jgi:dihydroorotase
MLKWGAAPQAPANHLYDHAAGPDVAARQLVKGDFGFVGAANLRMRDRQELIREATLREGRVMWDLNGMRSEDWDHACRR